MSCSWSPTSTADSEGERPCKGGVPSRRRGNDVRRTLCGLEGPTRARYEIAMPESLIEEWEKKFPQLSLWIEKTLANNTAVLSLALTHRM